MNPSELTTGNFKEAFNAVQTCAFAVNVANGWWDRRTDVHRVLANANLNNHPSQVIELLGLVTSECAEGMEAARKHPKESWGDANTKDTLVRECAGAVVRLMDLCGYYGLPLADAIIQEIQANAQRGYMHGGKAA